MDKFLVVVLTGLVGYKYVDHKKNKKSVETPKPPLEQENLGVMADAHKLDTNHLDLMNFTEDVGATLNDLKDRQENASLGATLNDLKTLQKNVRLGMDSGPVPGPGPGSVPGPEPVTEVTVAEKVEVKPKIQDSSKGVPVDFAPKVATLKFDNSGGVQIDQRITGSHPLNGRSASMTVPAIAEDILRRDGGDDSDLNEQYFPQDTKSTGFSVTRKPWHWAVENSHNRHRSETIADEPTRQDIKKLGIAASLRNFGELHTERTLPRSSEKQFESPVEQIQTQNAGGGGLRGQRQLERHHKFLLNNEPALELPSGPRGNFASGANKSVISSSMDNSRVGLDIMYTGAPVAPSFKVGFPEKSYELEASNAEGYLLDKHTSLNSRAPVEKGLSIVPPSFSVAHDNELQTLANNQYSSRSFRSKAISDTTTDKNTSSFKDATIDTQTVLGAPGGTRLVSNDKTVNVDNKTKGGLLALGAARVNFEAGAKKTGPSKPVRNSSVEHPDTRLAEEDTSVRVRGSSLRNKSVVTPTSMTTNDNRAVINTREFTSKNFLAPQDKSLPLHLRNKPTSSITATRDMVLKTETLDELNTVRGRAVDPTRPGDKLVTESTKDERRLGTILNNRMSSGKALELLQNPYKRPAANRFKQLQAI